MYPLIVDFGRTKGDSDEIYKCLPFQTLMSMWSSNSETAAIIEQVFFKRS